MGEVFEFVSQGWDWFTNKENTNIIILLSAILAAIVASITIWYSRRNSRDMATIDIIHTTAWDSDFIKAKAIFKECREAEQGLSLCLNSDQIEKRDAVVKILNHYELVSIGIKRGIFSAEIYADYYRDRFVLDWFEAKPLIGSLRNQYDKDSSQHKGDQLWCEYQALAEKWSVKYSIYLNGSQ